MKRRHWKRAARTDKLSFPLTRAGMRREILRLRACLLEERKQKDAVELLLIKSEAARKQAMHQ